MNKKIIGVTICTLLMTTATLVAGDNTNNITINLTSDEEWVLHQKLLASDGEYDDWFGFSIDIDGDYAIVGARWDDVNGVINAGSAYIFKYDDTSWVEEAKLYAPDGSEGDWFGHAVSISGDYAFISAVSDETSGKSSGSIYVFKRDGTTWTQEQKILVPISNGNPAIDFGWSICIEGDYALVGAINDNDLGDSSGSTYVFKYDGSTWNQEQKLLPADGKTWAYFGYCISIDGDYAIIGARADNYIGAAYIYKLEGATWTERQKLVPGDGATGDYFGKSVSMNGDYAIIGSTCDDDNGEDSGSAYIFKNDGSSWIQEAKIIASDGEPEEEFGWAVSINGDHAVIGVSSDDENGMNSGSAYIFKRDGLDWTEQTKLVPSDGGYWEQFGHAVSMKEDSAFICAVYDDENGQYSGSTYVYERIVKEPDLDCTGTLSWDNIAPEATVTGSITVENIGDEGSLLDWEVESYPEWGTWTFNPESGTDLQIGDSVTVEVEVIAPPDKKTEFTGTVKIINSENPDDYCEINVVLKTPRGLSYQFPLLQKILERFPILKHLLGL